MKSLKEKYINYFDVGVAVNQNTVKSHSDIITSILAVLPVRMKQSMPV